MPFRWVALVVGLLLVTLARPASAEAEVPAPPTGEPLSPPTLDDRDRDEPASEPAREPPPAASRKEPPELALPVEEPKVKRHWYGWQTLLVDGTWVGGALLLSGMRSSSEQGQLGTGLVLVYFLGPPVVHFAHGHAGKGFLSLGLRVAGPLILVGGIADSFSNNGDSVSPLLVLGILAIPATIAIDAAAIAREDVDPEPARAALFPRLHLAPWTAKSGRGGGLSVSLDL